MNQAMAYDLLLATGRLVFGGWLFSDLAMCMIAKCKHCLKLYNSNIMSICSIYFDCNYM